MARTRAMARKANTASVDNIMLLFAEKKCVAVFSTTASCGSLASLFVLGLYEVITRILLASRAKAALACDNAMTHTVRTSSPVLMCLVIPLMMGYPRIFSVCRRIVSSSLFCRIGFSMKSFTPRS